MSWKNIPAELRALPQWVGAGDNKIPLDPKTGRKASVDDSNTWGTFDQACKSGCPHIGFVFTKEDPYVFIDLDTAKKPEMTKLHAEIISKAHSYTETSKSGLSSHIVVRGKMEYGLRADQQAIEIYPHGRYMLVTGWQFYGSSIEDGQELLDYLAQQINSTRFTASDLVSGEEELSDEEVYNRASQAENGDKFVALFTGQWQNYPEYMDDHSRADLALATFLDFYTQNVDQAVRLFKMSKLYRSEKGRTQGDGTDYILRTLKNARARNEASRPIPVDATEMLERAKTAIASQPDPAPYIKGGEDQPQITFPPGLVGEIANYIYTSASRPVPEVALMGALAMTAGIVGRQFNIPGSGLNLYLILLAPTGTGKEGASSGIGNLISKVRDTVPAVNEFVGPAEFASGPALIKTLDRQPCLFSIIGEFGLRLQQMADPRSGGAERTLQKALLNLFSKSGWHQTENSSAYSDKEKNTSVLYAPALTLFGESTPETFFSALSEEQVKTGLLPRFMFLEYTGPRPPRNTISAFCDPDPGLVQRVADMVTAAVQMQANHSCQPVVLDAQAQGIMDAFDVYCDQKINEGTEIYKQLWNRAHLKALRLAGVIAVGCNHAFPAVTEEIALWAIEFVKRDVAVIEKRFLDNSVGDGEHIYEALIREMVTRYLSMSFEEKTNATNSTSKKIAEVDGLIPYKFLYRRLINKAEFKRDRRGAGQAAKQAIFDMVDIGVLQEVPPMERKEKYQVSARVYMVGEAW